MEYISFYSFRAESFLLDEFATLAFYLNTCTVYRAVWTDECSLYREAPRTIGSLREL